MDKEELYAVVGWPDIQSLMDKDGFYDNAYIVNDTEKFGSSAYFVNLAWLEENS